MFPGMTWEEMCSVVWGNLTRFFYVLTTMWDLLHFVLSRTGVSSQTMELQENTTLWTGMVRPVGLTELHGTVGTVTYICHRKYLCEFMYHTIILLQVVWPTRLVHTNLSGNTNTHKFGISSETDVLPIVHSELGWKRSVRPRTSYILTRFIYTWHICTQYLNIQVHI